MPIYKQIPHGSHKSPGIDVPTAEGALAWFNKNRRALILACSVTVLLALGIGGFFLLRGYHTHAAAELWAGLPLEAEARHAAMAELAERYPTAGAGIKARFELGRMTYEAGRFEEALAWYAPLLDLSDQQAMIRTLARHNKAVAHEALGEWQEALDLYRLAALDPANQASAYSYYDLGRAYQALGQGEEAKLWFEKAREAGQGLAIATRAEERIKWLAATAQP